MRIFDILNDKRFAKELSTEQIEYFVSGVTDGSIMDYQASALLMAICINGMTVREAGDLTLAMAHSGEIADLSGIKGTIVDKHSSGGVGDKCTLIVGPIVSSVGIPFAKLSGRGLGHTGGTIDKLESIKGFRTQFNAKEFIAKVNETGIVIAGQTGEIAPADKKLYAIRDVTATVQSIPLIAASIMSKKLASGANSILLDVKCGNGAFMEDLGEAQQLASLMVGIGKMAGKKMKALITNMNQPLGNHIGNGLEVTEAYQSLCGNGPSDLMEISIALSAGMMELAGLGTFEECKVISRECIQNGSALKQFRKMVLSQGGSLDNSGAPVLLGNAGFETEVLSRKDGVVKGISTRQIGIASLMLGAGRQTKSDTVDPAAGIVIRKKLGETVQAGESIATLYTNLDSRIAEVRDLVLDSYDIQSGEPHEEKYIYEIID